MISRSPFLLWGLAALIAACTVLPTSQTTTSSRSESQSFIQPVSDQKQDWRQKYENPTKRAVPSQVETAALDQEIAEDKSSQLNQALEELKLNEEKQSDFAVSSLHVPSIQIVRFMTQTKNLKQQIKIPENGTFKLIIEAGNKAEIVDGDSANDGIARIRLPQSTYETLIHLQGPWRPDSELEVEDNLYYVKDNLSSKKGKLFDLNRWFLLGIRPLPIPQTWRSREGQNLVLHFKTKGVKEFQIAWWRTAQQAAFPPGIQEVGAAGGYLKLPGVGEMEIPPGALAQNTVIVMRQKEEVYEFFDDDGFPGPDEIDVAPPVEFHPTGLQFIKPAHLRLNIDSQKVKGQLPGNALYVMFPDDGVFWEKGVILDSIPAKTPELYMTFHEWYEIPHFSFVRVLASPRTGFHLDSSQEDDFQIAAAPPQLPCPNPPNPNSSEPQYLLIWDSDLNNEPDREQKKQAVCTALLNSHKDFLPYARGLPPVRWFKFQIGQNKYSAVPIYLKVIKDLFVLTSDTSGRTFAKSTGDRGAEMWVDPSPNIDNIIDSSAHENYHAFQVANMIRTRAWQHAMAENDRAWLPESSARFMGSLSSYKHFEEYKKFGIASHLITFVYNQIPYLETLGRGLELLQKTALYDTPNIPEEAADNRYFRMNLFSLIHTYHGASVGLQKIHDANVKYFHKDNFTNEGAVEALHEFVKLDTIFPLFASMTALKDYGMGTETAAHFSLIKNTRGNLETVDYTTPVKVPANATETKPFSITSNELQNLRAAHRYIEFPELSKPYMAYIYLENASTNPALSQLVSEDLAGKGARILVLQDPGLGKTWKERKPEVAVLKNQNGNEYSGKLIFLRKNIKVEGVNRNIYFAGIPVPVGDKRVRLILSTTNPYVTDKSDKQVLQYQFKAFMGPMLWDRRGMTIEEDPSKTKIALKGAGFDPDDTWVVFENRDNLSPLLVKAESVKSLGSTTEETEDQEIIVQIPNNAKVGGWVSARSGQYPSQTINQAALACNMLDDEIHIASLNRPCINQ